MKTSLLSCEEQDSHDRQALMSWKLSRFMPAGVLELWGELSSHVGMGTAALIPEQSNTAVVPLSG